MSKPGGGVVVSVHIPTLTTCVVKVCGDHHVYRGDTPDWLDSFILGQRLEAYFINVVRFIIIAQVETF
jgi:hypothetical protein